MNLSQKVNSLLKVGNQVPVYERKPFLYFFKRNVKLGWLWIDKSKITKNYSIVFSNGKNSHSFFNGTLYAIAINRQTGLFNSSFSKISPWDKMTLITNQYHSKEVFDSINNKINIAYKFYKNKENNSLFDIIWNKLYWFCFEINRYFRI